jgi:hypothetical protein
MLFVVSAEHNTGHGPAAAVLLVTEDISKALVTARTAKSLGYEFYDSDSGVSIYKVELDRPIFKKDLKFLMNDRPGPAFPVVVHLRGRELKEEWFDEALRRSCN